MSRDLNTFPKKQVVALFVYFLIVGCAGPQLFEAQRLEAQPEAGAVNLSVTMTALWEEYATTLQPKFELPAKEALEKVIPKTTLLEERLLDALSLKAKLGLPQTFSTKTTKITEETGTTSSEKIETSKAGEVPKDTVIPQPPKKDVSTLPALQAKDRLTAEEPMLEYSAAAALFQEIQLLNRYVEDAALKYGYQPYVIRLQVGVLPYARNLPYDVYTTLAFFPFSRDTNGKVKSNRAYVVPLLVTDNLEGTLKSRSTDTIRQLAFALSFLIEGVTGEVGLSKLSEDLRSVIGTDLNSLMTVSRVTDNSIQVRLGAARQPTAGYAMIPRTHNITILLMVPRPFAENKEANPYVKVVAKSVMRDSEKGNILRTRPRGSRISAMRRVLMTYYPDWEPEDDVIGNLFAHVFRNNYPGFRQLLEDRIGESVSLTRELWLQFIENAGRSEFSATTFDLPRLAKLNWPSNSQAVLFLDDGKNSTTGRIYGGAGMHPQRMSARLNLRLKSGSILHFMATSFSVSSRGSDAVLTFPSLKAWSINNMNLRDNLLEGSTVEMFYYAHDRWNPRIRSEKEVYKTILYRHENIPDKPPG